MTASDPDRREIVATGGLYLSTLGEDGVTTRRVASVTRFRDPDRVPGERVEYLPAPDDGSPEHVAEIVNGPTHPEENDR